MEPQAAAAPQNFNQPAVSNVPATWPGGFGLFKYAKNAYMVNLGPNLLVLVLSIVIGIPLQKFLGSGGTILSEIISIVLSVVSVKLYLAGSRGEKLTLGAAFPKDFMLYLKYFGLSILIAIVAVVSLLLLVVPFFIVMPRLSLASYYLIDKDMGVMEAYKASWNDTKGHTGKVYGIVGATIVFLILILVLVGFYFLIMYSTAYALLYLFLTQNRGTDAAPVAPIAPTAGAPVPPAAPAPQAPVSSAPQDVTPQPPVTPQAPPQV